MEIICETSDLLVFSHQRWDFVFQRPQHLLSRFAKYRRVFYVEEPVFGMTELPRLHLRETSENVLVVIPYLPSHIGSEKIMEAMSDLVDELVYEEELIDYTVWYYNPTAIAFTQQLKPKAVIIDYMDDFWLYGSNGIQSDSEKVLLNKADVVFTGGHSLYEAKKALHHNIHHLPNSIDYHHFSQARHKLTEPDDQINIPHPRIGFYGIIDERFDVEMLLQLADLKPAYQFIMIGPVVRIDPSTLPRRNNIHYLGKKDYHALPLYLAGWDCTIMPFVRNESTRYISPTKTAEILAAGKPVVSTSIQDVVNPYGIQGLVHIADKPEDFLDAIEIAMSERKDPVWLDRVDHILRNISWDLTFKMMAEIEMKVTQTKSRPEGTRIIQPVPLNVNGYSR